MYFNRFEAEKEKDAAYQEFLQLGQETIHLLEQTNQIGQYQLLENVRKYGSVY